MNPCVVCGASGGSGPPGRTVPPRRTPEGAATNVTTKAIADSYNPLADTEELRMSPDKFEHLRNHYHLREEVI